MALPADEMDKIDKETELILNSGSFATAKNPYSNTLTLDTSNGVSSFVFGRLTKPITVTDQVRNAIEINVKELVPNIPAPTVETVSTDTYNALLSQSIDLQNIADELRTQIETLDVRVSGLEGQLETEISERTATEQTNQVLLNQLDSLSSTINGFADQISTALQKSVEESIFRTSLQAQNEGFKAQINGLLSQIDSLNILITGLYAQLGAVQIQRDIEDIAKTEAAAKEGWNVNSVVAIPEIPGECTHMDEFGIKRAYRLIAKQSNATLNAGWKRGGGFTFVNYNKVPVKISLEIRYPIFSASSTPIKLQKFFTYAKSEITLSANAKEFVKTIWLPNEVYGTKDAKSIWYEDGKIKITVRNETAGTVREEVIPMLYGMLHPDTYGSNSPC